ncbi:MAG: cation-efflux pump [Candidatus Atabeyarchaeum deiterrae]
MGRNEKQRATIIGVVAASFLTGIKLFAGIISNSLAVLAEAAHSALDLASAGIGFFAIRASDRPADSEHMYGHGKADTVGGFFAALLLLVTCGWIMLEGINRLLFYSVVLDITLLTFVVIAVSIAVDSERTYVFRKIGKKTGSPTIQGESLHFASDIASSAAVLGGLFFVTMGYTTMDTYLALAIAVYFGYTSLRLMAARINDLLDKTPALLRTQVEEVVSKVKGVKRSERIRVRKSGSKVFVDVVVDVDPRMSFVASHSIGSAVEDAVTEKFKDSDVLVHVNPTSGREDILDTIRRIALNAGAEGAHGVDIESYGNDLRVSLHLEFSPSTKIGEAHKIASNIETEVRKALPKVTEVTTHIEPDEQEEGALETESKGAADEIRRIAMSQRGIESCHNVFVAKVGSELHVTMHCTFDEGLTVNRVHRLISDLEKEIKSNMRDVGDVVIHPEPIQPRKK